ncbi:FAD-dependent oxidoreductase [Rickettsia endosymbiont of Halotydeus destructor]|uniref:FAD-dependent oxidoreductase n=1 Tax=Rickettsia endosymbiont of Halotydeus destructor TaxID=2996754 RepID=UPI003BB1DE63
MKLGFNLNLDDLDLEGLKKLDRIFLSFLLENDEFLYNDILFFRSTPHNIFPKDYSNFLLKIAPFLDDFLAELFSISKSVNKLRQEHKEFDIIYECKRKFIQRYALKKYPVEKIKEIDFDDVYVKLNNFLGTNFTSQKFAEQVIKWQLEEESFAKELEIAAQYAACRVAQCYSRESGNLENNSRPESILGANKGMLKQVQHDIKNGENDILNNENVLFTIPQKVDKDNLINPKKIAKYQKNVRIDFDYFDPSLNLNAALNNAHYCIYCHKQEKDSCSKGFAHDGDCKERSDEALKGCPLKQKISEMNYVKAQGFNLAALAIIVIDNPMVAATGHKICNDCLKACIYQKQESVDIPLIESNILEETLKLPYGLEIYLLLTRWNPLNIVAPLPKKLTGYNILVTGLGPAGFSLSYYLLRSGHNVVAIDGLKVTPLPFNINKPIKYWLEYKQRLSERIPKGFGGVAEYGITSRWDKNNLDILRLILERNKNFKYYGAIRLGSNITTSKAFELGFDHIAFCIGAGQPKILETANFAAKGVKTASDFLMTLQSSGAFLEKSITNMVIRMPIAIIGGGLTSLDVATESFYYYKMQVAKFFAKYELAVKKHGKSYVEKDWTLEDREIANEFVSHTKLFKNAKDFCEVKQIFNELGGITIYYRGNLQNSPAYKLNHEELMQTMAVGINFAENMQLHTINVDKYDYVESVEFRGHSCKSENAEKTIQLKTVKAKTVIMAVGTENAKIEMQEERYSYFGDCDPKYAGSVVKALASSKEGYESINKKLDSVIKTRNDKFFRVENYKEFFVKLDSLLNSKIEKINILADKIVELVIHAPAAAQNFKPGQFFRLQNYSDDVTKLMEPLALTGAYVDLERSLIYLIVLESGQSSNLCRHLSIGESVALMGPTGAPTEILKDSNVVLIGGGLGNAVLLSIGQALKKNNCKITYFAGYKKLTDRFYAEKIAEIADKVIWCYEEEGLSHLPTLFQDSSKHLQCHSREGRNPENNSPSKFISRTNKEILKQVQHDKRLAPRFHGDDIKLKPHLLKDKILYTHGTVIDGIKYIQTQGGDYSSVNRIIAIGSSEMMEAVQNIKNEIFGENVELIVSVNSLMQCMMKGICGQCLQKTKGDKSYIFACACQDQNAEIIDFSSLKNRLRQNAVQEKLQNLK